MEKFSVDQTGCPNLIISQPKTGYRFSTDPFILANNIQISGACRVMDVGCGCGIIALLLASRFPGLFITGVEIQSELAQFARQNVRNNKLDQQINILCCDINHVTTDLLNGTVDLLVSNPPYKKANTGRVNPDSQKAIARHELSLNLDQLFDSANRLLHENGRIFLIFPAERWHDLKQALKNHLFYPVTLQWVHTHKNKPAKRLILCADKHPGHPCTSLPPVYL
ncbi:MAG: methyltransferase [Pseudomonadota bacterium]